MGGSITRRLKVHTMHKQNEIDPTATGGSISLARVGAWAHC